MTSFGLLSTYPPTQCGLAGFSAASLRHLTGQGSGDRAGVVRVVDAGQPAVHPFIVAQVVNSSGRARHGRGGVERLRWPRCAARIRQLRRSGWRGRAAGPAARDLLADAARLIGTPRTDAAWPWPEPWLSYANAAPAEVLIAAGHLLDDERLLADGLALLGWLLDEQTREGHLSLTPAGGHGRGWTGPGFDQQPIEAAALADACARAFAVTGADRWQAGLASAVGWFLGANDSGVPLADQRTGGCCDGLEPLGRNENQGAESTLALISTLQHQRK